MYKSPASQPARINKKSNFTKPFYSQVILKRHIKAAKEGWRQFRREPFSTLTTCSVIAIILFLTTALFLTLKTFQKAVNHINATNEITFYLKTNLSPNKIQTLLDSLKHNPHIKSYTYTPPDKALEELLRQDDFREVLTNVENNPLPPVIRVQPLTDTPGEIESLAAKLRANPLIAVTQVDLDWLTRLTNLLKLANRLSYVLLFLFSLGVIFIVSHTIQSVAEKNHQEIALLQLMGAAVSYTRRPLLYLGTFLGVTAGIISALLLTVVLFMVQEPVMTLMHNYKTSIRLLSLHVITSLLLITFSGFLGIIGSWIAFYKYVKII